MSATADPERPAKRMDDNTFTWASPPRRCPINAWENCTRRMVIPPLFISSPASMKNGIAISGKLSMPL